MISFFCLHMSALLYTIIQCRMNAYEFAGVLHLTGFAVCGDAGIFRT